MIAGTFLTDSEVRLLSRILDALRRDHPGCEVSYRISINPKGEPRHAVLASGRAIRCADDVVAFESAATLEALYQQLGRPGDPAKEFGDGVW